MNGLHGEKPLVTIGIPTRNRAGTYLGPAIRAALAQTYEHLEILVSDNCSDDQTPELVAGFGDPRIRYVRHSENLGALGNMNYLVNHARGNYLLILHDDDHIDPDFTEACMAAASYRSDAGLIVTGSRVIDDNGVVLREKENRADGMPTADFIMLWYRKGVHLFMCNCLFNTTILREAGGFLKQYDRYDDVAAEFICAARGPRVDVREVKASMREHAGSETSHSDVELWCRSGVELLNLACELAPQHAAGLRSTGRRVSAERNYRYAAEAKGFFRVLGGYVTVFRYYRKLPPKPYFKRLVTGVI